MDLPVNLIFRPLVPLAFWASLAVTAAGLLVWYFVSCRRRVGAGRAAVVVVLMGLTAAGPLGILLNPTWLEPLPPPPDKPMITVVVDRSASMNTRDAGAEDSRYAIARRYAAAMLADLGKDYELRVLSFAEAVQQTPADGLGEAAEQSGGTDVSGALDEALSNRRLRGAAVVLLSDGAHTTSGGVASVLEAAERARVLGTPLYTCTIGGPVAAPNLSAAFGVAQELAYVDQQAPLAVTVNHQSLAGQRATIKLGLLPAGGGGESLIGEREITLDNTGAAEAVFKVQHPETGLYRYRVEVACDADEATLADNRASMLLRVVDEPIRVVVLEGKPYWDSKFLLRNLAADRSTQVVSYVRMGQDRCLKRVMQAGGARSGTPGDAAVDEDTDPADERSGGREESWEIVPDAKDLTGSAGALADCQIVVLGRDVDALLDEGDVERLREWVSYRGGSLVCARGAPTSEVGQRLYDMLPLRWTPGAETRFRVGLTDVARDLRSLGAGEVAGGGLAAMPSLSAATRVRRTRPLTTVLAESSEAGSVGVGTDGARPVIAYHPLGAGVVVAVEGAGMWRWAFLPPDHADRDAVYGRVWSTLIRWLVSRSALLPGQEFALAMDKVALTTDEVAAAQLLLSDDLLENQMPRIRLSGGGLEAPLEVQRREAIGQSGAYRLTLGALAPGSYTLEAVSRVNPDSVDRLLFDVRESFREKLDLNARPELMRRVATRSGGAVIDPSGTLADQVQSQFDSFLEGANPPQFAMSGAWDRPWVLVLLFAMWATTWAVRRRFGLI